MLCRCWWYELDLVGNQKHPGNMYVLGRGFLYTSREDINNWWWYTHLIVEKHKITVFICHPSINAIVLVSIFCPIFLMIIENFNKTSNLVLVMFQKKISFDILRFLFPAAPPLVCNGCLPFVDEFFMMLPLKTSLFQGKFLKCLIHGFSQQLHERRPGREKSCRISFRDLRRPFL